MSLPRHLDHEADLELVVEPDELLDPVLPHVLLPHRHVLPLHRHPLRQETHPQAASFSLSESWETKFKTQIDSMDVGSGAPECVLVGPPVYCGEGVLDLTGPQIWYRLSGHRVRTPVSGTRSLWLRPFLVCYCCCCCCCQDFPRLLRRLLSTASSVHSPLLCEETCNINKVVFGGQPTCFMCFVRTRLPDISLSVIRETNKLLLLQRCPLPKTRIVSSETQSVMHQTHPQLSQS